MRTPDAERARQWRARQVHPVRSAKRANSHQHEKIGPDPYFAMAFPVTGYQPSKRAIIRPAFERLEASGPVVTLVHDGKPVYTR